MRREDKFSKFNKRAGGNSAGGAKCSKSMREGINVKIFIGFLKHVLKYFTDF